MALREPPSAAVLRRLPAERLAGRVLHRIYSARRDSPWWFATQPAQPQDGGRFDLPAPHGSCYLAGGVAAATVEALQDLLGRGLLQRRVLERLSRAQIDAPSTAPRAARLTTAAAGAVGVTAALWAGPDRALTQRWAAALHRAWDAIYTGVQHDPTGRGRAVTLFDDAGEHPPYGDAAWRWVRHPVADDPLVLATLARYGTSVVGPGDLAVQPLPRRRRSAGGRR
ncbi:MAG: hypothetical protein ACT4PP_13905 [Sporichthyaceae bacterium]